MPRSAAKLISLVVPVFNEEESIGLFLERTRPHLDAACALIGSKATYEILFVNDGSSDSTEAVVAVFAARDRRIKLVTLSRNFGKEAALAAGLRYAAGDAVIPIDVDLQDPPCVIPPMVEAWLAGAKAVDAVRADRTSDSWLKRFTSGWFYRIYNRVAEYKITANAGDFRLLDREVVNVLAKLTESSRFNKGLFSWVGFERATVTYTREKRAAGSSKWKYWRLWNFALDGIVSSTTAPLRVWTYVGLAFAGLAFAYICFLVVRWLIHGSDTPGYASLMTMILLIGGLNMLSLGVLGEYVGRISKEVRGRPIYIVNNTIGIRLRPDRVLIDG